MNETPWWKRPYLLLAGLFGILMSILFAQKRRADKAEGEVEAGKAREKDSALKEREAATEEASRDAERRLDELRKEKEGLSETPASPDEVKKYWEDK